MSLLDAIKMPGLADIGKRLTDFINAANAKLEAQTAALIMLGEQVKVQNALLRENNAALKEYLHGVAVPVADDRDVAPIGETRAAEQMINGESYHG